MQDDDGWFRRLVKNRKPASGERFDQLPDAGPTVQQLQTLALQLEEELRRERATTQQLQARALQRDAQLADANSRLAALAAENRTLDTARRSAREAATTAREKARATETGQDSILRELRNTKDALSAKQLQLHRERDRVGAMQQQLASNELEARETAQALGEAKQRCESLQRDLTNARAALEAELDGRSKASSRVAELVEDCSALRAELEAARTTAAQTHSEHADALRFLFGPEAEDLVQEVLDSRN